MTIAEAREKCKSLVQGVPRDLLIVSIMLLASSFSFGLGYLAGQDASSSTQAGQGSEITFATSTEGTIVASKGGTKYYLPGCAGADRISVTNKVWFVSVDAAEAAGYTLATNCKGR
jgi:hypothetical protein